jgi:hypothetical protein
MVHVYSVSAYLMLLVGLFVDISLVQCVVIFAVSVRVEHSAPWLYTTVFHGRCFCEVVCVDTLGAEHVVCHLVLISCSALNTGLHVSVCDTHLQAIFADLTRMHVFYPKIPKI